MITPHRKRRSALLTLPLGLILSLILSLTVGIVAPSRTSAVSHSATLDLAYIHDRLDEPISTFVAVAVAPSHDPWFDWSTDLCSAPLVGNTGRSFNFTESCRRHDFAYRNLHRIEARYRVDSWNGTERLRADRRFLSDMLGHCATRSILLRATCRGWAYTFYYAVRTFGASSAASPEG